MLLREVGGGGLAMCPQRRHSEVWCSFQAKAISDFYLAFGTLKSDR